MSWFTAILGCCGLGEGAQKSGTMASLGSMNQSFDGEEAASEAGERHQELSGTVSSEKVYLANLESYKVYRFNIQKEQVLPDLPQLFSVFDLLDDIYSLHATLLTKLEGILAEMTKAGNNNNSDLGLGSCFLSCISSFQVYSMYAKLYSQLKGPLAGACAKPGVSRSLETIRKKCATQFSLTELLVLPLHRLHRYVSLLQQFRDSCPAKHPDLETLNITVEKFTSLVDSLQTYLSSEQNEEIVLRIERNMSGYPGSLYVHGRSFLVEINAHVKKTGGGPPGAPQKERRRDDFKEMFKDAGADCTLFLFSDLLLVTTQKMLKIGQYNFVEQIQLPHIQELKNEGDTISLKVRKERELITVTLTPTTREKVGSFFARMKEARAIAVSKRVFGVPLEVLMMQPKNQNRDIPGWLEDAILHISLYSLKTEGIFRISATAASIQSLKDDLDDGKEVAFDKTTDCHVLACCIKLWLRELPEHLLPHDAYKMLAVASDKGEKEKIQIMRNVIEGRPEYVQYLLQHLFCFGRLLASYSEYSKMNPTNLSIVFAPNLVPSEITLDPNLNKLVEHMILFYDEIFSGVEQRRIARKKKMFFKMEEEKRSQREINDRMMKKESEFSAVPAAAAPTFTSQVLKQGYLTKKGDVRRNWTTRWFVLRYNWLGYYKSPEDINNEPKGSIVLKACTFEDTSQARTFSFSIHDPRQNRTFQIQAKNAVEHQQWCEAIRKMIEEVSKE